MEGSIFQLQSRLSSTQESIKRTRLALFFCIVGALASLACLWNTTLSVDRLSSFRYFNMNLPLQEDASHVEFRPGSKDVNDAMIHSFIDNWMQSTYINIGLLGLKVSVSDFAFYNSTAMLLLVVYLLLAERRENREIGRLLQDVFEKRFLIAPQCLLALTVYRSVMSYMIFNLATRADNPIRSLKRTEPVNDAGQVRVMARLCKSASQVLPQSIWMRIAGCFPSEDIFFLRVMVQGIFFLPCASVAANMLYHFYFIWRSGFPWEASHLWFLVILIMGWEFLSFVYIVYLSTKTMHFHRATKRLVEDFKDHSEREARKFSTQTR